MIVNHARVMEVGFMHDLLAYHRRCMLGKFTPLGRAAYALALLCVCMFHIVLLPSWGPGCHTRCHGRICHTTAVLKVAAWLIPLLCPAGLQMPFDQDNSSFQTPLRPSGTSTCAAPAEAGTSAAAEAAAAAAGAGAAEPATTEVYPKARPKRDILVVSCGRVSRFVAAAPLCFN